MPTLELSANTQVRQVTHEEFAGLMGTAFNHVADPSDWRGPIDCLVPWEVANVYVQAIEYFTAVKPDCDRVLTPHGPMAHLSCCGYRAGPAGP